MVAPDAAKRALEIAEIVLTILDFASAGTIKNAIRVNRLWFNCAFSRLWRYNDDDTVLLRVENLARRQLYASVRERMLLSDDPKTNMNALKDLQFNNLRTLTVNETTDIDLLRQCFTPSVTWLVLDLMSCDDDLFAAMSECAEYVQEIWLSFLEANASPQSVANFIRSCKSLRTLKVTWEEPLDDSFVLYCATLPRLEFLQGVKFTATLARRIFAKVADPFMSLLHLNTAATSAAVPILLNHLHNLTELKLSISGTTFPDLRTLPALVNLTTFILYLQDKIHVKKVHLLPLYSLHSLKDLRIESSGARYTEILPQGDDNVLTDSDFEQLIINLPLLEALFINVPSRLTAVLLLSLGKHCPRLDTLASYYLTLEPEALQVANSPSVDKFCLETLELGTIVEPNSSDELSAKYVTTDRPHCSAVAVILTWSQL
ncbi:hypothetical protein NQ176_g2444 [Zarea fungicola]|uniref:Uncharacterized protein n=1 Tax=Zarea fungicola TaxID=93591 RepID=A0ACC1NNT6_9HYPO|nr:hypothetical protein NQ176_g2444 [Lecanicillium fungicola]